MRAERGREQVGDQYQHFIAVQMAEFVVNVLEMVDIHHGQPLFFLLAVATALRLARQRNGILLGAGGQHLGQLVVESLAVEQAGQRVALAVVQQVLKVAVHADDAADDVDGIAGVWGRIDDFQAGVGLVAQPDRQPQGVLARFVGDVGAGFMLGDAVGQGREQGDRVAGAAGVAVDHACRFAGRDDGARPHKDLAPHGGQRQYARLTGTGKFLHRRDHRDVEHRVIAVASHVHHVFQ